ncbi:MAG TPA: LuxR C-terminal-related transcriptional regulator [Acidimicrobiales bacterium]|nr:LuxR C-terminal-related transcriptional regulator [Acidimicrobiales bacterium]
MVRSVSAFVERDEEQRAAEVSLRSPRTQSVVDGDRRDEEMMSRRLPLASSGVERRTWVADAGCRIIACVDVEAVGAPSDRSVRSDVLWELAVRRMERCIRPNDVMCMLGGNRFAVSFGNGGNRVPPSVLGSRLARALGDHLSVGPESLDVRVSVGIAAGPSEVTPAELASSALLAVRSSQERLATAPPSSKTHAMVTVTHVPGSFVATPTADTASERIGNGNGKSNSAMPASHPLRRLVRRVVLPLSDTSETQGAAAIRQVTGTVPRVLVVGAGTADGGAPRLAVEAVAAIARQMGARTTVSPSSDPERVILDLYVAEPHVVVVVLENDACRRRPDTEGARRWERPARLVRALRDAGAQVVAMGVGASAAAVAACVEQGAVGLLDADELPGELTNVASAAASMRNGNGANGNGTGVIEFSRRFPAPFAALVGLTPSERKVLFHMMEGRSAAEIAEALVVSLPTVRSHIRSILRKLNVNSQLAAVAIANGALPDGVGGA